MADSIKSKKNGSAAWKKSERDWLESKPLTKESAEGSSFVENKASLSSLSFSRFGCKFRLFRLLFGGCRNGRRRVGQWRTFQVLPRGKLKTKGKFQLGLYFSMFDSSVMNI